MNLDCSIRLSTAFEMFVKPEDTDETKRILHLELASIGDGH